LKENYDEIYSLLTQYLSFPDLDLKDDLTYLKMKISCESDFSLWNKFEEELSSLNYEEVLFVNKDMAANPGDPDFRDRDWHAYEIEMEQIVNNLTTNLSEAFRKFILDLVFPVCDSKMIKLKHSSIFLNFNYTDTLERYYSINSDRILYIHGMAKNAEEKIVLGHATDPKKFKIEVPKPPKGLSEDDLMRWEEYQSDQYDLSYDLAQQRLISYFYDSFKPTTKIIEKNRPFFESLKTIKEVFVLGHSLSSVDRPYFKKVVSSIADNNVKWTVTYHKNEERDVLYNILLSLGLLDSQIELIKMDTLQRNIPRLF
jgi:hypothetical protein